MNKKIYTGIGLLIAISLLAVLSIGATSSVTQETNNSMEVGTEYVYDHDVMLNVQYDFQHTEYPDRAMFWIQVRSDYGYEIEAAAPENYPLEGIIEGNLVAYVPANIPFALGSNGNAFLDQVVITHFLRQ